MSPPSLLPPDRPLYRRLHEQMRAVTDRLFPQTEWSSIDEFYADTTDLQMRYPDPAALAQLVKQSIFAATGLHCTIAVAQAKPWRRSRRTQVSRMVLPLSARTRKRRSCPVALSRLSRHRTEDCGEIGAARDHDDRRTDTAAMGPVSLGRSSGCGFIGFVRSSKAEIMNQWWRTVNQRA